MQLSIYQTLMDFFLWATENSEADAWPFLRSASEAQPERSQKTEKFKITIKLPSVFLIKEQASLIQGRAKWENAS